MNEELRDRLATVEIEICGSDECHKDWVLWKDNADAVLAEIEAAGYVLVEREQWRRVRNAASVYYGMWLGECLGHVICAYGNAGLAIGDLDREADE